MTPVRWAAVGVVSVALLFGFLGGEYSTFDWLTLKRQVAAERAAVAALQAAIDSLKLVAVAVERDPAEQERIAREEFGMIREGEFLYRLVAPSDSVNGER